MQHRQHLRTQSSSSSKNAQAVSPPAKKDTDIASFPSPQLSRASSSASLVSSKSATAVNSDPLAMSKAAWEATGARPKSSLSTTKVSSTAADALPKSSRSGHNINNVKSSSSSAAADSGVGKGVSNAGFIGDTSAAASASSQSAQQFTSRLQKSVSMPELRHIGSGSKSSKTTLGRGGTSQIDLSRLPPRTKAAAIKRFLYGFGVLIGSGAVFTAGSVSFQAIIDAIVGPNAAAITSVELDTIIQENTEEILNSTLDGQEVLKDEHHHLSINLNELRSIVSDFRNELQTLKFNQTQEYIKTTIEMTLRDLEKGRESIHVDKGEEEKGNRYLPPRTTPPASTLSPFWGEKNARYEHHPDPDSEFEFISPTVKHTQEPHPPQNPEKVSLLIAAAVVIAMMLVSTWCCVMFIVMRCVMQQQQR